MTYPFDVASLREYFPQPYTNLIDKYISSEKYGNAEYSAAHLLQNFDWELTDEGRYFWAALFSCLSDGFIPKIEWVDYLARGLKSPPVPPHKYHTWMFYQMYDAKHSDGSLILPQHIYIHGRTVRPPKRI